MKSVRRRWIFGMAGVVLSALGLWFVFRDIDLAGLLDSAQRIVPGPLIGSLALYWGGMVVCRSIFVSYLLRSAGAVRVGKAFRYICIGYLANNVLPLRMGEVTRIVGIARSERLDIASVTGGVALERLLDMLMIGCLGIIATQLAPIPPTIRFIALAGGGALAVSFVVAAVLSRQTFRQGSDSERKIVRLVRSLFSRFTAGLGSLRSTKSIVIVLGTIAAIWLFLVGAMVLRLWSFGLPATVPVALVLLFCLGIGVALPSAPAYTGVYHAAAVLALHDVFHIDKEIAVGFAFFSWIVDVSSGSLAGAVSLILEGLSWSELRQNSAVGVPEPVECASQTK